MAMTGIKIRLLATALAAAGFASGVLAPVRRAAAQEGPMQKGSGDTPAPRREVTPRAKLTPLAGVVHAANLKAIVTAPAPTPLEQAAAKELGDYLKKIYNLSLPVRQEQNITPQTTGVILLGAKAALQAKAISKEELAQVGWDGYVIKAEKGRIALAGPRGQATFFAVSGFLQHLGCRFYGPVETIPTPADKGIPAFALSDRPAFEFRRCQAKPGWKLRTSCDDLGDPTRDVDPELFKDSNLWIDHTAGYLLPIKLYFDKHPEYFALIGGKRVPSGRGQRSDKDATPCLAHPEAIKICVERLSAWIEKQPERRFFAITYGDADLWCECEDCKKLDAGPGHADRLLYWVNAIAREVGRKYPDKVFWTFAYISTQAAPTLRKPEPNVIVFYTPWHGRSTTCRMHPYSICWRSVRGAQEMEDWLKWAPGNLGVYDYSIGPHPQLYAYAYKIKFWAKRGYRGFFECGNPNAFRDLENFVKASLLWDPSLDPAALEDEFCEAYYGPAGKHVRAFLRTYYLEKVESGTHKNRGDPEYPARKLECLRLIDEASAGTPFQKRIQDDLEAFIKQVHGYSLAERKEKLKEAVGTLGEGGLLPEIEPAPGYQGYDRSKLWLSEPKIDRKDAKDDARLTQLTAIRAQGPAGDVEAAKKMQAYIEKIYGIRLPLETRAIDKETTGVMVVGRTAALASGLITEADFKAAGPDGAVVRGRNGRIAIAASRDEKILSALDLFLYLMRMRHGGLRVLGDKLPTSRAPIIREFTLIDWPPFGPGG